MILVFSQISQIIQFLIKIHLPYKFSLVQVLTCFINSELFSNGQNPIGV